MLRKIVKRITTKSNRAQNSSNIEGVLCKCQTNRDIIHCMSVCHYVLSVCLFLLHTKIGNIPLEMSKLYYSVKLFEIYNTTHIKSDVYQVLWLIFHLKSYSWYNFVWEKERIITISSPIPWHINSEGKQLLPCSWNYLRINFFWIILYPPYGPMTCYISFLSLLAKSLLNCCI